MGPKTPSARLDQLLRLAQAYRGWTRKQLAEALNRDPTRLVPESGNPKLDLVLDLARVMDWPVEEVATYLGPPATAEPPSGDVKSLLDASRSAHREGRYRDAVSLAQRALSGATTGEERAIASVREASGWDGLGRYTKAMDATRRGLSESGVSDRLHIGLQTNLAIEHYTLWQLVEANAIAASLLTRFENAPPEDRGGEIARAYAYYVRGHSYRRIMGKREDDVARYAHAAKTDLVTSISIWEEMAAKYDEPSYLGVANTCRGGVLELDVALGERDASDVIDEVKSSLASVIDPTSLPAGDELESYGWWCIFGCNIALRHVTDPKTVQQTMAMLTNKADEIAVCLDNWALRERVFTMDYERRQRFSDWTGLDADWTIDKEDLRLITGTIGRFPRFRDTGWQLIESSKIIFEK